MSKPRKPTSIDELKSIGLKVISELEESNLPAHRALLLIITMINPEKLLSF
jgi:hypothetical protein